MKDLLNLDALRAFSNLILLAMAVSIGISGFVVLVLTLAPAQWSKFTSSEKIVLSIVSFLFVAVGTLLFVHVMMEAQP